MVCKNITENSFRQATTEQSNHRMCSLCRRRINYLEILHMVLPQSDSDFILPVYSRYL